MKQMAEIFENEKSSLVIENGALQKRVEVSIIHIIVLNPITILFYKI